MWCGLVVVAAESGEVVVEIVSAVAPVERLCGGVVAVLEGEDPGGQVVEAGEVGGRANADPSGTVRCARHSSCCTFRP